MEFIFKILRENPEIGTLFIATTFTAIGFIFKTLIDTFLESRRYKKELKKIYWTERINAAKKASEYYYDHQELLGLMIHKIDIVLRQDGPGTLPETIQNTIEVISQRTVNPNSFEHHHIHMFYDFDTEELNELNTKSFNIIQELQKIEILESDTTESINIKLNEGRNLLTNLKSNHQEQKKIYKSYLRMINEDLAEFIK
ncbi:hypothetical protein JM80_3187 [Cellulophaga sp. RHA_52]|uniref:hypothetical protein n=1 Tax=Cellulophaga sp. RHA_52 TaxID=1250036 RepID=UPI00119C4390|nr:hypothetical protein [Cellulophaga sp. RHA_52]TVZ10634.1 hypothetical protein JM80_3187 [Cellulophaga sp. RHA_52]